MTSGWPPGWPHAHGGPLAAGEYRTSPEDFVVEERLDFTPEGEGEHLWLWVEKRDLTTLELARRLARACEVSLRDVGFSGMKDRTAVTRQWLSVHLPGREAPNDLLERLGNTPVRVLEQRRHPRKLKRGVHRANGFRLRISGPAVEHSELTSRWRQLIEQGVPNYFGPQRFGPQGRNLERARAILARGWRKRDDREGLMLSTARSYLFNELLAARLVDGNWATPLDGEVLMLDGSASIFSVDQVDPALVQRAACLDLHPAGVLWGIGSSLAQGEAGKYEIRLAKSHAGLCAGLERAGVRLARRALRVRLADAELIPAGETCELRFELPRGAFATAVLRELMEHPTLSRAA
ncbi:tRNA pseudouridine(13) synthase TruD [Modicisalibacter xianhensis]|uniref:tRNA pseudouridine synthase D n=1 Tax=Modicisalibacter xianhensis TaxID=442341 RepID=A0A1I3DAQ1_9GAMM|nr:tRNA pseudouridine(13) synthase TruD [Halomonas xianhensis]SFH83795.1 tRNA pseudouridine13 synthase [Halomonas xianhensis]